jgi:hypothetical protein
MQTFGAGGLTLDDLGYSRGVSVAPHISCMVPSRQPALLDDYRQERDEADGPARGSTADVRPGPFSMP